MPTTLHVNSGSRQATLAEALKASIRRGRWMVGSQLPPTRQIAAEHRVSLGTVHAAFQVLEELDLIECRNRHGVFVRAIAPSAGTKSNVGIQHIAIVGNQDPGNQPPIETWGYRIIDSIQNVLARSELHPTLVYYDPNSGNPVGQLMGKIQRFGESLVGVIVFFNPLLSQLYHRLDEVGLPWVVVSRPDRDSIENFVAADNLLGCQLLGECLARMGHQRVLILMGSGIENSEGEREKVTGLLQGFIHADAPLHGIDYICCGAAESAFVPMQEYLRNHRAPQAIFALGDYLASGAMQACIESGLAVPNQVKVVGGSGLEIARHMSPTLTVIAQPMSEMGDQAVQMIQEMVKSNKRRIPRRRIRGKLIVRESLMVPEAIVRELEPRYPGMIDNQVMQR